MALVRDDLISERALEEHDTDQLGHQALAEHVADLAANGSAPLNVALFGAWGSGKSSFYELLSRSAYITPKTELVRYDAWKYGGAALRRHFISHLADVLGIRHPDFARGLYAATKTLDLDRSALRTRWIVELVIWAVGALLAGLLLVALLWGFAALGGWIPADDAMGGFGELFLRIVPPVAALLFSVGALKVAWSVLSVEVHEAVPSSEEQFSRLFRRLVAMLRRGSWPGRRRKSRLIVFIDELDRCAPGDVVATLSSLKTFLGESHCTFIVAADRDVLERAVATNPGQPRAASPSPYYSAASSFIDKIFQFQFRMPPLRTSRLEAFAHDLVKGRGGIWDELASSDDDENDLDAVLYLLTPSHLTNPRRVKVLLNNFAVNSRTLEARGIDWSGRAAELAKLTTLQTEFPLLEAALIDNPRLPSKLLEAEPDGRAQEVLEEALQRTSPPPTGDRVSRPLDEPVDPDDATEETEALAETQRDDLMRYLKRAKDYPDPSSDLFYLEAVGAAHGIEDANLARVIELAADDPEGASTRLLEHDVVDQLAAAQALAGRVETGVGRERENYVTAISRVNRPRL